MRPYLHGISGRQLDGQLVRKDRAPFLMTRSTRLTRDLRPTPDIVGEFVFTENGRRMAKLSPIHAFSACVVTRRGGEMFVREKTPEGS